MKDIFFSLFFFIYIVDNTVWLLDFVLCLSVSCFFLSGIYNILPNVIKFMVQNNYSDKITEVGVSIVLFFVVYIYEHPGGEILY